MATATPGVSTIPATGITHFSPYTYHENCSRFTTVSLQNLADALMHSSQEDATDTHLELAVS